MKCFMIFGLSCLCGMVYGAPAFVPDREVTYATVDNSTLKLHIFQPKDWKSTDKRPAIVFFFGGGWMNGSYRQFEAHSRHLADLGMVALCADYRTEQNAGVIPSECVKDAKSAMRYVRAHAAELGIDPDRLAAGGGSAGGHLAIATAVLPRFNHDFDDLSVSCMPNALVLYNPVLDAGPTGYGYDRVKDYWKDFSPMENLHEGIPPTIVFAGTIDRVIPIPLANRFKKELEKMGSRCEICLYEGQNHGFFNYGKGDNPYYGKTVAEMDRFLRSLGYVQ